jgi:simple sugar transport system permease protein
MDPNTLTLIAQQGLAATAAYLYASLGESIGQRSGVYNLGTDGVILMGAFTAFYTVFLGGSPLLALVLAAGVGVLLGWLMSVVSVTFRAEQGISGIGLYMLGLGMSTLLFNTLVQTPRPVSEGFDKVPLPFLSQLPVIGTIFFNQSLLVYGGLLLVPLVWWGINKTRFGLNIRAVGQNPQAADSAGINVTQVRYSSLMIGGALAGIAGASLSISQTNIFQQNMTNGLGFIAVALVYFGGWSAWGILGGALLFSVVTTLQLWMQTFGVGVSPSLLNMLPNIVTIIALTFAVSAYKMQTPAALGTPYRREEN